MAARRIWKYQSLIDMLADDRIYSPATIAALGRESPASDTLDKEQKRADKERVRKALWHLPGFHDFPEDGDEMVKIPGQQKSPGWFGWRWKQASRVKNRE